MKNVLMLLTAVLFGLYTNAQWISINPGAGGQVQDVVCDPNIENRAIVASDMEGIYETTDNGESWHHKGNLSQNCVYAVTITPGNSNKMYIGTRFSLEVSTDGGNSTELVDITKTKSIGAIAVDPNNTNNVLAGVGWRDDYDFTQSFNLPQKNKGEVFRSTDGGATWTLINFDKVTSDRNVYTIQYDPNIPDVVYIGAAKGVFKSTDGGLTWAAIPAPSATHKYNSGAGLSPDGKVMYASFSNTTNTSSPAVVFATLTSEINWKELAGLTPNPYWYPEVDSRSKGTSHKVLVGMMGERNGLYEVTCNWTYITSTVEFAWKQVFSTSIVYDIGWDITTPNCRFAHYTPLSWERALWSTTNQTIQQATYNAASNKFTWHNKYSNDHPTQKTYIWGHYVPLGTSKGTESTYTWDIAAHENYVIQGQGDNGPVESWDGGKYWSNTWMKSQGNLSDAKSVEIADPEGTPVVLAQLAKGYGGFSGDGRLYAKVLKNHDLTDTWSQVGGAGHPNNTLPNEVISDIAASPANPERVFVFSRKPGLYMCDNTVSAIKNNTPVNFTKISNGVANSIQTSKKIAPHPTNQDIVFLTSNQGSNQGVYKGVKSGENWTWSKVYNGSDWDAEVTCWENNGQVYVFYTGLTTEPGGDGGHYIGAVSLDEGATWKVVIKKEIAKGLNTPTWYKKIASLYKFKNKGGACGYGNNLFMCYYDHNFQKTYGVFKGTIDDSGNVSWIDWTGNLHFGGSTSAVVAKDNGKNYYYLSTAGAGAWKREIGSDMAQAAPDAAPTNLKTKTNSSSEIELTWNDNASNEAGYKIERKEGAEAFVQVASTSKNVNTYLNPGLNSSTYYTFRVRAYNKIGDSEYSNESAAATEDKPFIPCETINLVKNNQFDYGLTDWLTYASAAVSPAPVFGVVTDGGLSGANAAKVTINGATSTNDIQFYQIIGKLASGKTYSISFKAKSDAEKKIDVKVLVDASPWSNFFEKTINLSTTVETYGPFEFTPSANTAETRIDFLIGADINDFWVDSVVVAESCPPKVSVANVLIDSCPTESLGVGNTIVLSKTVLPVDASNKNVSWASSNEDFAAVSSAGVVTGVSPGETTITVTTNEGTFTAVCNITVEEVVIIPDSVSIDNCPVYELIVGDKIDLNASVFPANATDNSVAWQSSSTNASVEPNTGLLTAISAGDASITVTTTSGNKIATCNITVVASGIKPESVVINNCPESEMYVGDEIQLSEMVLPLNATNKSVSWSSSSEHVAVSGNGLVKAISVGDAIITVATISASVSETCNIIVLPPAILPTSVTINNRPENNLNIGDTVTLFTTVLPTEANDKTISWSSSNPNVVEVNQHGLITAKASGAAFITAQTNSGDKTATCQIFVSNATVLPTSVVITNCPGDSIVVDEIYSLLANVLPANADNSNISWASSDPSIASVNSSGEVTAKAKGSTTITVITDEGGFTASCTITVKKKINTGNHSISKNDLKLYPNPTTVKATVEFENIVNSVCVDVVSITGTLVYSKSWDNKSKLEIDLSNLNSGFYNVRIKFDNKTIQKPLVVMNN